MSTLSHPVWLASDVDDDLQAALMGFSNEVFEVLFRAVGWIDA